MSQSNSPNQSVVPQQPRPPSNNRHRHRHHHRSPIKRVWRFFTKTIPWRIIFIFVLLVIVVGIGTQAVLIADAANQLNTAYTGVSRVLNTISSRSGTDLTLSDFDRLQTAVNDLSQSINTLDNRTRSLRQVLPANTDIDTQFTFLKIAQELTSATNNMLSGLQPTIFYMVDGEQTQSVAVQISSSERIVELLEIGQGRFELASKSLETARTMLDTLDLSKISPNLLLRLRDIENFYTQIHDINSILVDAPTILSKALGFNDTQTYLLLAENSDELRPSGGYISTYGWLSIRNGSITDYNYYPTTSTSPTPPTSDAVSNFSVPSWWIQYEKPIYAMWDGSWYAGFPQTAEMARNYYNLGANNPQAPVAGVLSIDIYGFQKILEALGSVRVERIVNGETTAETITANNFRTVIYDIRAYGEGDRPHKQFLADVYKQIFADWQTYSTDPKIGKQLLGVMLESLLEKHIMVYIPEEKISNALRILGWDGSQTFAQAHEYDYLMVADANLGNKSNHSITRQLTYDVLVNPDRTLDSRISIDYDYPDAIAKADPAVNPEFHGPISYNNLLQVFVPDRSMLTNTNNIGIDPITTIEDQFTIFVSRVRVAYDSGARYQFSYKTPPLLTETGGYYVYRLLVQKQPGTDVQNLNVQLSLPSDAKIVSTTPEPATTFALDNLILDFRLAMKSDQWIEVIFNSDSIKASP